MRYIFSQIFIKSLKLLLTITLLYYDRSKVLQIKLFLLDLNWEIPFLGLQDFTCLSVFLRYSTFIQDLCFIPIFGIPFYNLFKGKLFFYLSYFLLLSKIVNFNFEKGKFKKIFVRLNPKSTVCLYYFGIINIESE